MRLRFFLICFAFLLVCTVSITSLLAFYYRSERLSALDDQIRETATSIIDSRLSDLKTYDYALANSIISDELGPDRVGKFFIIRNEKGDVLFETDNIKLLEISVPRTPKWITINEDDRLIRAVNLELPSFHDRTLQVGAITDSGFIFWTTLNKRTIGLLLALMSVLLLMTWFLSAALFSPVRKVGSYLKTAQGDLEDGLDMPLLPTELQRLTRKRPYSDEFNELVKGIQELGERINLNTKFTRSWTFQMAHELKTPLTILNRTLEDLSTRHHFSKEESRDLDLSLKRISGTITNFLDWAELATTRTPNNLHVIKIVSTVQDLKTGWEKIAQGRLRIEDGFDFEVLCNPPHLSQLLDNLVSNALKYSRGDVELKIFDHLIQINDHGAGIPKEVMAHLGSPFNKGPYREGQPRGTGLGLAWVQTISDLYAWKFEVRSNAQGTEIEIRFPRVQEHNW